MQKLMDHFQCAARAWNAPLKELSTVKGFERSLCEKIVNKRKTVDVNKTWSLLNASTISILLFDDPRYPPLLKQIYDPPLSLYYLGDIDFLATLSIAVVGSRRHTHYGKQVAQKLASALALNGITVTSGMARGIDTWSHRGALDAKGKTIAVLGCGLDICYPPENKTLKERIQCQGLVISEFPPGTHPAPLNFPRRNRIISGLSLGTVVVEAGVKSGALITAEFALEQGREVFAIPGSIESPYSQGCHKLLKEGARLVETVEDILEEISLAQKVYVQEPAQVQLTLDAEEFALLDVIQYEPVALEKIAGMLDIPLSKINALLLEMELKGIVKQLPGKYYVRNTHGGV